ncbi:hypothetical protein [Candidatus Vidania fulgoroideorum]
MIIKENKIKGIILYEAIAGIILKGSDVKELKKGNINIKKMHITLKNNKIFLKIKKEIRYLLLKKNQLIVLNKIKKNAKIKIKNLLLINNMIKFKIVLEKVKKKKIIKDYLEKY